VQPKHESSIPCIIQHYFSIGGQCLQDQTLASALGALCSVITLIHNDSMDIGKSLLELSRSE